MRKQWSFRALAVLLILSLLVTMSNRGLLSLGENTVTVKASGDTADDGIGNYITYNGTKGCTPTEKSIFSISARCSLSAATQG